MSKNSAEKVVEIVTNDVEIETEQPSKIETPKKVLKRAEKAVRRMDNILSDLVELRKEVDEITVGENSTDISEKDFDRFTEMSEVVDGASRIIYHLTARMARKYVEKEIESVDTAKGRKSLKK